MSNIMQRFKDIEFVVNCKTEEQAKQFISICYDNGLEWFNNSKTETNWNKYNKDTCYRAVDPEIVYANINYYKKADYKIITFDEFMKEHKDMKKQFTKDDLKVGMLVECEEMGLCIIMEDPYYGLVYVSDDGYMTVSRLNDNFDFHDKQYSINKVWDVATNYGQGILNTHERKLLWEREVVKELTVEEISNLLGYKVRVVGGHE